MALDLYLHPLSSFCWKALLAFYENETPFEPIVINLGDAESRAKLTKLWPVAKFPLLHDKARNQVIPESTIIIEYLAQHYPGKSQLVPKDPDRALEARLEDRFFDFYVHMPMQKIVGDKIRPADAKDPHGVAGAKAQIETAYEVLEERMATRRWALGDDFTIADCAATPALYYANRIVPLGANHKNVTAYKARLEARPAFKRVFEEAAPFMHMFPG
jgi:glutathione S-transferase